MILPALSSLPFRHVFWLGCALLMASLELSAQSSKRLSADQLCRTSLKDGDEVVVTGKYKELIHEELYLFDCGMALRLEDANLFGQLLNFTPKEDNLTVEGVVITFQGERMIQVRLLSSAPADFSLFFREFNELSQGDPDAEGLIDLGRRVLKARTRQDDPRLLSLARQVFESALQRQDDDPDENQAARRVKRISVIHEDLKDDTFARDMVVPILQKHPDNKAALAFLRELKCRRHDGRWLTYTEYKNLEGLVEHGGRWITPRERHHIMAHQLFAQENASHRVILLRRRTEKEYLLIAEEGRVETGMKREEVCLALGFPDLVTRLAYKRKEFDQWTYGKKYYYFYDGVLVFLPR